MPLCVGCLLCISLRRPSTWGKMLSCCLLFVWFNHWISLLRRPWICPWMTSSANQLVAASSAAELPVLLAARQRKTRGRCAGHCDSRLTRWRFCFGYKAQQPSSTRSSHDITWPTFRFCWPFQTPGPCAGFCMQKADRWDRLQWLGIHQPRLEGHGRGC